MAATRMTLVVYYEDESEQQVIADQRDMSAFERQNHASSVKSLEDQPLVTMRELAYLALKRTNGGTPPHNLNFAEWDLQVVEVATPEDEAEDANDVNPTKPEASAKV
jgi:hypothetical protein